MNLNYLNGRLKHAQSMDADVVKIDIEEFASAIEMLEKLEEHITDFINLRNKLDEMIVDLMRLKNDK